MSGPSRIPKQKPAAPILFCGICLKVLDKTKQVVMTETGKSYHRDCIIQLEALRKGQS